MSVNIVCHSKPDQGCGLTSYRKNRQELLIKMENQIIGFESNLIRIRVSKMRN